MRRLVLLLALLPGPARAQDDACAALWARLGALAGPALSGEVAASPDGWCEARDVRLGETGGAGVAGAAEQLRWRGEGLDALAAGTGLPTAVEVEVEGLRTVPMSGDAAFDWLLAAQGARGGVDGRLSAAWDARTGEARLATLDLDFPGRSAVRASATVTGLDLTSLAAAQVSLGGAGLTALSAEVVTDGLFETYLLLPIGGWALEGSDDPEKTARGLKALLLADIARLPPAIFPDPTRAEAAAFVATLPNPLGTLDLRLAAEPGLGPSRFARFALTGQPTLAELWPALDGVTVEVAWEPLPPED